MFTSSFSPFHPFSKCLLTSSRLSHNSFNSFTSSQVSSLFSAVLTCLLSYSRLLSILFNTVLASSSRSVPSLFNSLHTFSILLSSSELFSPLTSSHPLPNPSSPFAILVLTIFDTYPQFFPTVADLTVKQIKQFKTRSLPTKLCLVNLVHI